MAQMTCSQCSTDMVPVQRAKGFSLAGLFSAFAFLGSLLVMAFNFGLGIIIAIAAILIGTLARGKNTHMVCPKCGHETGPI